MNRFRCYPYTQLRGCVQDAHDVACVLIQHFGSRGRGADICLLADAAVTRDNILAEIDRVVESAGRGRLARVV